MKLTAQIIEGDCLESLRNLPDQSIQSCVTSPPYWGLRDYGHEGQIGLESTPEAYVAKLVQVFREVRRVLRDDGTCWVNLGDSYAGYHGNKRVADDCAPSNKSGYVENMRETSVGVSGLKPKDLVGIPWRVAFALQADGWWLRQDIIWHKPNPMPESVTDRCTKAHEYVFLLSKSERYFFDSKAISEPAACPEGSGKTSLKYIDAYNLGDKRHRTKAGLTAIGPRETRNRRSVWTITTKPYKEAHFATFPPELPRICILASSKPGDTILDPFGGSGTTGMVATELARNSILLELNPKYATLARQRTNCTPGLPLQ